MATSTGRSWTYDAPRAGLLYPRWNVDVAVTIGQIEPLNRMTVEALKGALDNFARSAVVRQVALAGA